MNVLNNNTSLYFYSAVFQGNMALLALGAVFVVFKLQTLSDALQRKDDLIISFVEHFCNRQFNVVPDFLWDLLRRLHEFETKIKEKLDDPNYKATIRPVLEHLQKNSALANHFEDRRQIIQAEKDLVKKMRIPFLSILVVILASLILLPLSTTLHVCWPSAEPFAIMGTVLLNVSALVVNSRFILNVLHAK